MAVFKSTASGRAATLSETISSDWPWQLYDVRLALSATLQATLNVTFDSGDGAVYDTVLYTTAATSSRYARYSPDRPVFLMPDDKVLVDLSATGATYGLTVYFGPTT